MVLGAVVVKFGVYGILIVTELSLGFTAVKPVETHIRGFSLFGGNTFVGESYCCGMFRLDKRVVLRPTHFDEVLT